MTIEVSKLFAHRNVDYYQILQYNIQEIEKEIIVYKEREKRMNQDKGILAASVIIAVSLIFSVYVFKNAYISKSYPQDHSVTASLNTDLSGIINAIESHDANKDALSLAETAKYLGIKEDYFTELFNGGKLDSLPFVTIAGYPIFSKKSLDEWIYNSSMSHRVIKP